MKARDDHKIAHEHFHVHPKFFFGRYSFRFVFSWCVGIVVFFVVLMRGCGTTRYYHSLYVSLEGCSKVALNHDGSVLVGGIDDGQMILWNTKTKKTIHSFNLSDEGPGALAFHPTKKWLIACDHARLAMLVDYESGKKFAEINVRQLSKSSIGIGIKRVFFSSDGNHAYIACRNYDENHNHHIVCWNIEADTFNTLEFDTKAEGFYTAAISPDGKIIAVNSTIFNIDTREKIVDIEHGNVIDDIFFLPDSKRIVTSSGITSLNPHNIAVWDIETGKKLVGYVLHHGRHIGLMVMIPGGRYALSAGEDKSICIWEIETGKVIWTHGVGHLFSDVAVSADGSKGAATDYFAPFTFDLTKILSAK